MDAMLCARCKGKGFCGKTDCPIVASIRKVRTVTDKVGSDFFGASPPSVFVGRFGYPQVFTGVLAPAVEGDTSVYDDSSAWFSGGYSIEKIFDLRASLINSRVKSDVYRSGSFIAKLQEIALASKPLDIEAKYDRPIKPDVDVYSRVAPTGPRGDMIRLDVCDNPKVPKFVDKIVSDTDLKATDAVCMLDGKSISENHIVKLLSLGLLGEGKGRKLVPTRWSITATDDMIAKRYIEDVRGFDEVGKFLVFSGEYLGNHFEILLMPGTWSFECIEVAFPKSFWSAAAKEPIVYKDYEKYSGRKSYASNVAGGYYATRLPVAKYLKDKKIQASVLSLREIYEDYSMPLGVWVLRETVSDAFSKDPVAFDSLSDALSYMKGRLRLDFSVYLGKSDLLRDYRCQRRLFDF